jgi:hypothetical protein
MPDNEVPDWMEDAMRAAEEQSRLIQPYIERALEAAQIAQRMAPAYRRAAEISQSLSQQYAEQRRLVVEMIPSVAPVVEFMQRNAEQVQQALAVAGLLFGYFDRTALAMTGGTTVPLTGTASVDLTATPTRTVHAEVVETAGSDVDEQHDARPEKRKAIDYGKTAVGLLWAWALFLPPLAVHRLSADAQQTLVLYLATIALALIITWRYNDNHKR